MPCKTCASFKRTASNACNILRQVYGCKASTITKHLDMSKIGFITDVKRGIHKIIDDGRSNQNNQAGQPANAGSSQSDSLIQRIKLFVEDEDYEKAAEYCERVLDNDPTNPYKDLLCSYNT